MHCIMLEYASIYATLLSYAAGIIHEGLLAHAHNKVLVIVLNWGLISELLMVLTSMAFNEVQLQQICHLHS